VNGIHDFFGTISEAASVARFKATNCTDFTAMSSSRQLLRTVTFHMSAVPARLFVVDVSESGLQLVVLSRSKGANSTVVPYD
jgi:hypothetical protein